MAIIVKLKLREETSRRFLVDLRITRGEDNDADEYEGYLPSIPERLQEAFKDWRSGYWSSPGRLTPRRDTPTNFSHTDRWNNLKKELNDWLNSGSSEWRPIRDGLIKNGGAKNAGDEIRVIIDTREIRLRRLPWQEWTVLKEHYPQAEVALNAVRRESKNSRRNQQQVRILLVEGCNQDINTNFDVGIIENLRTKGAEVTSLRQPDPRTIQNELRNQAWDIMIFSGHSISDANGQIGWIELNQNDRLRIEDFERALSRARSNGLQLAIFNSCDGLGLANQLELPQSIVMREPVPDEVAVEFLYHFFEKFTAGESLFASVREARESLEHFNRKYPGIQSLPTLCVNTTVKPVTWESLVQKKRFDPVLARWIAGVVAGGAIAILAMTLMRSPNRPSTQYAEEKTADGPSTLVKTADGPSTFPEVKPPPGNWQYSSSPEWKASADRIEYEIEKVHPYFNIVHHEHQNPIDFLFQGQVAFVLSSIPINDEDITRARDRGWELEQKAIVTGTELVGCSQLFVIFRKDGQLDEEAGVAYSKLLLTDDGQKLIKSCGQVTLGNVN